MDDARGEPAAPVPLVGQGRRTVRKKPEGLLPKVVRVGALFATLGAVLLGVGYQRARGQLGEALMGAGAQMMLLADAIRQDSPRDLVLNGERIRFSTGIAPLSMDALLDRFEQACERIDAGLLEQGAEAFARRPDDPRSERAAMLEPIMRDQSETAGFVACLAWGEERLDLGALLARIQRFERTRDLHDIGDLRYVYAQRMGDDRSHFVAVWTDGSLRFDALFPETGDAVGEDPPDLPRPPGARRMLSAYEIGDDQRAVIYGGSDLDEGELEGFYRRELPNFGWEILDARGDPRVVRAPDVRPALVARRGDRLVYVALATDFEGRGQVAVLETGRPSEPRSEGGS